MPHVGPGQIAARGRRLRGLSLRWRSAQQLNVGASETIAAARDVRRYPYSTSTALPTCEHLTCSNREAGSVPSSADCTRAARSRANLDLAIASCASTTDSL